MNSKSGFSPPDCSSSLALLRLGSYGGLTCYRQIVDLQGKPHKSDVILEDILCSVDGVKGCLRATSDMSIFLQIVDLLLGCVQFDLKDHFEYYNTTSRRAEEKRQLVNFVKSRLGGRSSVPLLSESQSFKQWDTPSLFTVRRGEW